VSNPGNQSNETGATISMWQIATGAEPMTWSASGLPPGLTISSIGLISGQPTTTGTYSVLLSATDGFGGVGSAGFTWTITPGPQLTSPGNQAGTVNVAIAALHITASGGTAPYTWTAANLPPGLSIDSSGWISGTPTAGTQYVTSVQVVDAVGAANTVTFVWTVAVPAGGLMVSAPFTSRTGDRTGTTITPITFTASGGGTGYTWSAAGLPAGMTMSTAGVISGRPTVPGTSTVTVTVTDNAGKTSTCMFTWTVS
jgi:Putative Ig domain